MTFLLVLGGVIAAPAAPAGLRSIRVVMDDNYPPFVFRDNDGQLQGLLVDKWRLWESQSGIKAELHAMDWDEALRRMRAGEFEVIDTVFKTPERAAYWDFSKPHTWIEVPIFFRKDIAGITDLKSLAGFPVAAKEGDAAADLLRRHGILVLPFPNYRAIVEAAQQHKINVFVVDQPPALYYLHKLGLQEEFRQSAPLDTGQFRRAVKKGDAALLQAVEQGFAALKPAEIKPLEEKWYGSPLGNYAYVRQLSYAVGATVLLLTGMGAWNISLKRLVKLRTIALQQSEQKFRGIFENAPVAIFQSTLEGRLLSVNAAGVKMFGYDSAEEFLASATDMARQLFVRGEQRQKIVAAALECERFVREEVEYRRQDSSVFLGQLSIRAVRDASGQVILVEGFVEDITQRKQAEAKLQRTNRTLRLLSECNQALVRAEDETSLLQAICGLIVQDGGYRMAWVGLAEKDEAKSVRPAAQAGFEAGYLEKAKITWADDERGRGPTGTAIRTGQIIVARNLLTDPAFSPWRQAALESGYAASATFPLKTKEGVFGALMVYAAELGAFDAGEVELLTQLASDLAYGITGLRARTERKRMEEALKASESQLSLILNNIWDVIFAIAVEPNDGFRFTSVNRRFLDATGLSESQVVGALVRDVIPESVQALVFRNYYEAIRSGLPVRWEEVSNYPTGRKVGHVTVVPVFDAHGICTQLVGMVHDITERRESEARLAESEQQFRLIMDNLADLVAVLDLEGHRLYNSPSYRDILGDPEQLRGTSSFAEVHPEDRARVEQAFQETVRTGVGKRLEYRMNDQRGRARHIESQGSVIRDDQGRAAKVVVVSRDVTARKRVEEELHRLSARLLEVHDLERRRLARELHDTTAQHLAALTLNLGNLRRKLSPSAQSAQALCGECFELAHQAAQEIRTQSYLLHPPLLEVMGLAGAVEDYAQGFSARSGIQVELEAAKDFGRLPEDMELALFRVLQESLANVLKHSGSRSAKIRLTRQPSLVILEVQDMGHGIPAKKLAGLKARTGGLGVGLGGMHERLSLLGGRLDLESGPAGTIVRATAPLTEQPASVKSKA